MEQLAPIKEKKKTEEEIIVYSPLSRKTRVIVDSCFILLLVLSIATLVIGCLFPGSVPVILEKWASLILAIELVALLLFFTVQNVLSKKITIEISREGISFPYMFKPDLLFRTKRSWDDVGNILFSPMVLADQKGTYEYEVEKAKGKSRQISIYFKSGGHATIHLDRIAKEAEQLLFVYLQPLYMDFSRVPITLKETDDKRRFIPQKDGPPVEPAPKSITELWEQDMQDRFSATAFVPLKKGKLLRGGRIRILMQLACGGLSAVYLAETPDKGLHIIKEAVLPGTLDPGLKEKAKELFVREAIILQRLSHPRIARVLDYFVEDGRDYLVLEFVPGHSLRQIVRQNGPLSEADVLKHTRQVAEILVYLHEQSPPVLHRDITPDNLVLREDGKVFLIDFGAANDMLGTATGTLVGKQAYIAPEQFRGKAQKQSDIYALGGSMYFLLTGQDPEALASSRPRTINADLSPGIDDLVAACTSQELDKRISSAEELCEKIEMILTDGGGSVIKTAG